MIEKGEIPSKESDPRLGPLRELRRELHGHPEVGWAEFWTTTRLRKELEALGYDVSWGKGLYDLSLRSNLPDEGTMASAYLAASAAFPGEDLEPMRGGFTGLVAHMKLGKPGSLIGLRFDIDGLPVRESSDNEHLPARGGFASENGNTHACGHDGHMAIGIGLARMISGNRKELGGEVYLLFQPAEEGGTGGLAFSTLDVVKKLDYLLALHLGLLEKRQLVCELDFMSCRTLRVDFKGKSAHAALNPMDGRNALLAASKAVVGLYEITEHMDGEVRANVGRLRSDNAQNVISDSAGFVVEVRGETEELADEMEARARAAIAEAASEECAEASIEEDGRYISIPSSEGLKAVVREAALKTGVPEGAIVDRHLVMGSEDATYLMRTVIENGGQAAYVCLCCPTRGGHHNPSFDFDEDMLLWGVDVLWELVRTLASPDRP